MFSRACPPEVFLSGKKDITIVALLIAAFLFGDFF